MNLRPHHALCVQKFTGHGYDEAFTRHMTALVRKLREDPDTLVMIISGCDDLCAHCPNCVSGACATLEKVDIMDKAVARLCSAAPGDALPWRELKARARREIFETEEFSRVCGKCEWYKLCLNSEI